MSLMSLARIGARALVAALLAVGTASAQQPAVILFVGNSFLHGQYEPVIHYNTAGVVDENAGQPAGSFRSEGRSGPYGGIPAIFKTLTEEAGLRYEVHSELMSGRTLEDHYANALPVLARKWDVVVMHDFSTGPVPVARGGHPERFAKYADLIEQTVHAANRNADVYLYETFPRADITYSAKGAYVGDSIDVMARDLHDGYARELAANAHIKAMAPAGDAWLRAFRSGLAERNPFAPEQGKINLWGADSYHPSALGAYLNALVLFQTITGKDPRQLGARERAAVALGIAPTMVVTLQRLAFETSQSSPISADEAELRPLFAELLAAANAHDTDRHLALYIHSRDLVFVVNDEPIRGYDSLRVRQRQWWLDGKSDAVYSVVGTPEYRTLAPGVVLQTYFLKSTRSAPDGTSRTASFGITSVWQKRPEGWRITYAHEAVVTR